MLDDILKALDLIFNDSVHSAAELSATGAEASGSKNPWVRRLGKLSCVGAIVIAALGVAAIAGLIHVAILLVRVTLSAIG